MVATSQFRPGSFVTLKSSETSDRVESVILRPVDRPKSTDVDFKSRRIQSPGCFVRMSPRSRSVRDRFNELRVAFLRSESVSHSSLVDSMRSVFVEGRRRMAEIEQINGFAFAK